LPRPAPHVLIYGGGAIGLLHAGLLQLRFNYAGRIRPSSSAQPAPVTAPLRAGSSATGPSSDAVSAAAAASDTDVGSVCVVSSQADLVSLLQQQGCRFEMLRSFVNKHATWMAARTSKDRAADEATASSPQLSDSHVLFPPLRLAASRSAFELPWARGSGSSGSAVPPFTHILLCSKGAAAFDHACCELLQILQLQLECSPSDRPLAAVCLLMNGMGHEQRLLQRAEELLLKQQQQTQTGSATDSPEPGAVLQCMAATAEQRSEILRHLRRQLVLATTTAGARLHKLYDDSELKSLRLVHGGAGVTTVLQNATEAREEELMQQQRRGQRQPSAASLPHRPFASSSVAQLFDSIGMETVLAAHAASNAVLYTKLLINCVINPLTALHSVRNGELLPDSRTFGDTVAHLALEFVRVLAALDVQLVPINKSACSEAVRSAAERGVRAVKASSNERLNAALETALLHVYHVAERTAANFSSMYTDLHPPPAAAPSRRRCIQSEIEQLTGYLLQQAKAAGMPDEQVRLHRSLYEQVLARERQLNAEHSSSQEGVQEGKMDN
jgi:ketopantoate reductase